MFRYFRVPLIAIAAVVALATFEPATTQADVYWDGYWGWYNNDYRPYYHRRHYRNYYDDSNYNRYYRGYDYEPYYYGRPDYDRGYYYNRHSLRGRHNSIDVGPLHIDWR